MSENLQEIDINQMFHVNQVRPPRDPDARKAEKVVRVRPMRLEADKLDSGVVIPVKLWEKALDVAECNGWNLNDRFSLEECRGCSWKCGVRLGAALERGRDEFDKDERAAIRPILQMLNKERGLAYIIVKSKELS
jgi:hypothetical protein